ncbi:hypothetical protein EG830_09355, partial [bacterium]|nr:hypothetical protein [bacterium]
MRRLFLIPLLILLPVASHAQGISRSHLLETARAFIHGYLGSPAHEITGVRQLAAAEGGEINIIDLKPEGWLLMSGDYSALPVLAFSLTGTFTEPAESEYDNRSVFLSGYIRELASGVTEKSSYINPGWNPSYYYNKSADANTAEVTVSPLISVTWNQSSGWNRFCPEDPEGP